MQPPALLMICDSAHKPMHHLREGRRGGKGLPAHELLDSATCVHLNLNLDAGLVASSWWSRQSPRWRGGGGSNALPRSR
jgi:hypothetical protein